MNIENNWAFIAALVTMAILVVVIAIEGWMDRWRNGPQRLDRDDPDYDETSYTEYHDGI